MVLQMYAKGCFAQQAFRRNPFNLDELPLLGPGRSIIAEKDYERWVLQSVENKKGGIASTFFAPNLTMNLTYLCYGNH